MKLTPLEIRKQEFKKGLRGFDPIEVQTFLDMVAEQYEQTLEENKSLSRRVIELETKLNDYQANEKTLRETLLNVQEVKKQSEESSRKQADLIIKEAELKALEILENARKQTRQIREEVNWLKSQKESFINRLRHILASQIELLSVMELDDALPEESEKFVKALKGRRSLPEAGEPVEKPRTPAPPDPADKQDPPPPARDTRIIQKMDDTPKPDLTVKEEPDEDLLEEDDINDFFKKGIQIDDLIKTINKKDFEE